MAVIDADTHVIEGPRAWEYMEPSEDSLRPKLITDASGREYWVIDDYGRHRHGRFDSSLPREVVELTDVQGRIDFMDKMGEDIQVIYPTVLSGAYSDHVETVVAMCRSYNRWMADVWSQAKGRIRWVLAPPILDMSTALNELEAGKRNGACGVMLRSPEHTKTVLDPYFDPLFKKAAELDLPICVHVGNGSRYMVETFRDDSLYVNRFGVLSSFANVIIAGIPQRFPNLRCGFIEAGSMWVPGMVLAAQRRATWAGEGAGVAPRDVVQHNRMWVACQTTDDLSYISQWTGRGNLITGTDFGHDDAAAELAAFQNLRNLPDVDPTLIDDILDANPRAFYGI